MPKNAAAPEPQEQYEGYRWLGSQWGRTGKPTPPRWGAVLMAIVALVVAYLSVRAIDNGRDTWFILAGFATAALCGLAGAFFLVEARFAERAAREQQPFTPKHDD